MRVRDYTESVYALYTNGMDSDTLITKLRATLMRKGHQRLLPKILTELLRMSKNAEARDEIIVTIADTSHKVRHAERIQDAVRTLGGTTHTTKIDPTISGGFIAERKGSRIDLSYKKQLLTIYRSLTK